MASILLIILIILPFLMAQKIPNCPAKNYNCGDWKILKDPKSGEDYGYKAFIEEKITFYEVGIF
jgi:hypothetical protein